ncbi:MAG TPA: hypothetical protein PKH02_03690 [Bacteroidales bacterium]|nr:hypothetical protein [Bacteroidales bacterium]HPT11440.1 hypothetical protein [Bacteroidales bacterium]
MKIFSAVAKGAVKSVKSYNLAITTWLITFIMIWSASLVLKASFNSMFGDSMISESLLGGFDVSILADLGNRIAPFINGMLLTTTFIILFGVLVNTFFAGGFYGRFAYQATDHTISDFFRSSARFFFPYLGIAALIALMIIFWAGLLFGLPLLLSDAASRGTATMTFLMRLFGVVFLLGLPVLLLFADTARSSMAYSGKRNMFRAVGDGFRATFHKFLKNYISEFIVMIASILLSLLLLWLLKDLVPEKGGMIFLFFILTQVIALLKVWVRSWRYATVTELVTERNQN